MERKSVLAFVAAFALAGVVLAQDKKAGDAGGPYGLPTLDQIKDKVKPTDEELKKITDIYTMAADGSNIQQVTHTPLWDSEPDWGPTP